MDINLKRGLLEIGVLKILVNGDSYGYQIVKDVSRYVEIQESTLYPILKRHEASGFVTVYSVEYNGRLRKYFKITREGKRRIVSFLKEWEEVMEVYDFIKEGIYE